MKEGGVGDASDHLKWIMGIGGVCFLLCDASGRKERRKESV